MSQTVSYLSFYTDLNAMFMRQIDCKKMRMKLNFSLFEVYCGLFSDKELGFFLALRQKCKKNVKLIRLKMNPKTVIKKVVS